MLANPDMAPNNERAPFSNRQTDRDSAMSLATLHALIAAGESLTLEFKASFDKASIESLVAFANTQGGIQADNYRSSLRNKLVAEGFYLINAIEKYGSGFIRIRQALQNYPEIDFEIKEFAGGVMVTFAQKQPESPPEGVSGGAGSEKSSEKSSEIIPPPASRTNTVSKSTCRKTGCQLAIGRKTNRPAEKRRKPSSHRPRQRWALGDS